MAFLCWWSLLLWVASNAHALPNILSLNQLNPFPLDRDPNSNSSAAAATMLKPSPSSSPQSPHSPVPARSLLTLPSSPPANDPIIYRVPNTPITLRFELKHDTIGREHMARTILQLQVKLRRFIASHYLVTNDVLLPSDNPYMSNPHYVGCFFAVTHWPPDRQKRLTYGMVDSVLKGVWEFLYEGGRFECADFYVRDDQAGTVGYGMVMRESPSPSSTNITEG